MIALALTAALVAAPAWASCTIHDRPSTDQLAALPSWVRERLASVPRNHCITPWIDPFALVGDFDRDGEHDVALPVVDATSGKHGIVVVHAHGAPVVLGAGNPIGNGGDDLRWMDRWSVIDSPVARGATEPGQALLLEKLESGGGIVAWTGETYRWHQQGD